MSEHRNAKSKAPKGKPSDVNPKGSGLKEAHATNDPETENLLTNKYTDERGEPAANVHERHVNRNTDKGRDNQGKDVE